MDWPFIQRYVYRSLEACWALQFVLPFFVWNYNKSLRLEAFLVKIPSNEAII